MMPRIEKQRKTSVPHFAILIRISIYKGVSVMVNFQVIEIHIVKQGRVALLPEIPDPH